MQTGRQQQQQPYYVPPGAQPTQLHWKATASLCLCGINILCALGLLYLRMFPNLLPLDSAEAVSILFTLLIQPSSIATGIFAGQMRVLAKQRPQYRKSWHRAALATCITVVLLLIETFLRFFLR